MELNTSSTIKQLIESGKPLKELRTILSKRDTTIRQVFNYIGYFYDRKQKLWLREDDTKNDEISFQKALEELKDVQTPKTNVKPNAKRMELAQKEMVATTELMSTNDKLMENVLEKKTELMQTNRELMDTPNTELMRPNAKLMEVNVLNALGMTLEEVNVLKQMVQERMNNETSDDIYSAIAKLGGRNRGNKTFYVSKDITDEVQQYCDDKGIKLSSFVEIALIQTMMKYK